jgi:hypothetical protein
VGPREFEGDLRRELREASTPVDRADRGNQPIDRRVDTISKQYQVGSARPHRTTRGGTAQGSGRQGSSTQHSTTQDSGSGQDGSDGGGAPWES